jgi:hypothetical protein
MKRQLTHQQTEDDEWLNFIKTQTVRNRSWKSVLRDRRPTVKGTGSLFCPFLLTDSLPVDHTAILSDAIK